MVPCRSYVAARHHAMRGVMNMYSHHITGKEGQQMDEDPGSSRLFVTVTNRVPPGKPVRVVALR